MKKLLVLSFCTLVMAAVSFAQKLPTDIIKFTDTKHDFGKIKQGTPVSYEFAFKNIASQPLIIESATASCGCTTPVKPEKPVAKGKSDVIKAGFNAMAPGVFNKTITVKVSGADMPVELIITGEVLSVEDYAKFEAEKGKKPTTKG